MNNIENNNNNDNDNNRNSTAVMKNENISKITYFNKHKYVYLEN